MVSNTKTVATNLSPNEINWQEHVAARHNSCISRAEYCRIHNLIYHQLEYQERKLAKNPTHKGLELLPVKLVMHEDISHHGIHQSDVNVTALCTLKLKDGHKLKIFDPQVLPIILNALV